jgi:hypothetical protein
MAQKRRTKQKTNKTPKQPTKNLQVVEFTIGLCTTVILAVLFILYVLPILTQVKTASKATKKTTVMKAKVTMTPSPTKPASPSAAMSEDTVTPTVTPAGTKTVKYTIANGDGIYNVSMKACGNESYYRRMINSGEDIDFSPGQQIKVTCN